MREADLIDVVLTNPINSAILQRLPQVGLADAWLVSGSLFQTVWNNKTGRPFDHGIKDYDIFYFDDSDLSWTAEDRAIRAGAEVFADLGSEIEIRNQARVHLWYPEKFGSPYPPLTCSTDGIDRFLAIACMVGVRSDASGGFDVYAPHGLMDLERMIIRPNITPGFQAERYRAKSARWLQFWPELEVIEPSKENRAHHCFE